jgi:hypothetical protein
LNELLFADEDGVAGVVPALIPRYDVESLSEKIDYFAFALVAPLGAQDDYVIHLFFARTTAFACALPFLARGGLSPRAPSGPLYQLRAAHLIPSNR